MSERLYRLAAIVRADFLIRLRRPSTIVVFLLLSALPYLWIPDPATGRTLMQIAGKRALYNSATIGLGTALIAAICIGLTGFYVVSNAIKRDVLSRCGYVIASTTMRGSEYIIGKFAGNVVFLTVFTLGFMACSMAMVLVRGEAPLQPLIFAKQYLMLMPPTIVFVSMAGIVFECTPLLRTKAGDVFYFFLWVMLMGAVAATIEEGVAPSWAPFVDISGMGVVLQQMRMYYNTSSLSVGASNFDPKLGTVDFAGLHMTGYWLATRVTATLLPIAGLLFGRLFFHRFDPARLRAAAHKSRQTWLGRFNLLSKPLARLVVWLLSPLARTPAMTEAVTTLAAFPLTVVAMAGFAIAALAADDAKSLLTGVMPVALAACAVVIADISSREKRAGTSALVFAAPSLRTRFVWWKFSSTLLVALLFLAVPLGRAIALRPSAALPLLAGVVFTAAAATALGIVSANPKTFILAFLTFWYVATQDRGNTPSMDFAGWFGTSTPMVIATYALLAVLMLTAAQLFHANELRRRW
jgi:hypothetical protein